MNVCDPMLVSAATIRIMRESIHSLTGGGCHTMLVYLRNVDFAPCRSLTALVRVYLSFLPQKRTHRVRTDLIAH